jgi:hypothetical protein
MSRPPYGARMLKPITLRLRFWSLVTKVRRVVGSAISAFLRHHSGALVLVNVYCLAAFFSHSIYAGADSAPTKQEAVDFLASELKRFSIYPSCDKYTESHTGSEGGGAETAIEGAEMLNDVKDFSVAADGLITLTRSTPYGGVIRFHASDIDLASIKVEDRVSSTRNSQTSSGGASRSFECYFDNVAVIFYCKTDSCAERTYLDANYGIRRQKKSNEEIYFAKRHADEAERVAKALHYIINVYGGQEDKEFFD